MIVHGPRPRAGTHDAGSRHQGWGRGERSEWAGQRASSCCATSSRCSCGFALLSALAAVRRPAVMPSESDQDGSFNTDGAEFRLARPRRQSDAFRLAQSPHTGLQCYSEPLLSVSGAVGACARSRTDEAVLQMSGRD